MPFGSVFWGFEGEVDGFWGWILDRQVLAIFWDLFAYFRLECERGRFCAC